MSRNINGVNVAVVGGAGFLGSHLVDHLINDRNCSVLVIDNLCAGRREFINPKATFKHGDITGSEEYLVRLFRDMGIEYVFNYAAYPYVPDSFERPLHVFGVNAFGALKVINAAQTAGCKAVLQVSSAEIYGHCHGSISEEDPVEPHSSYGASKAAIDAMVQVRWRESKTPVISLRQFNCIGERDFMHPYVAPEIIMQVYHNGLLHGKDSVNVYLGNNASRDFMYAGDAVRMATELLEVGEFGQVYNLGAETTISVYELARVIGALAKIEVNVVPDEKRMRPWEIWFLKSDNTKIYSTIQARPTTDFDDALRRTIKSIASMRYQLSWWKPTSV